MLEKIFTDIKNTWFYSEPLLFSVLVSHVLIPNSSMNIPMRSGKKRIEYNPLLLEKLSFQQITEFLKIEIYRILLLHPYERQPLNAKKGVLLIASDVVINHFYKPEIDGVESGGILFLKNQANRMVSLENPLGEKWADSEELKFFQKNLHIDKKTGNLITIDDLTFEEWYKKILFLIKETSISASETTGKGIASESFSQNLEDAAELWEEDETAQNEIQELMNKAEIDQGWGGIGGELQRQISEGTDFSFDYRRALTHFRQSIVSANRKLTRMRPSRRYGFKAMGSRYERKANVLIAVDVSGSITDESFEHFYHAIKNFFFLKIIENIDLIFFDVNLKKSQPIPFSQKIDIKEIQGRGGTSFQSPIDFFCNHSKDYSGLIIFTDGEGDIPSITSEKNTNILWILDSRIAFEKSKNWINSLPGNKSTYLPF